MRVDHDNKELITENDEDIDAYLALVFPITKGFTRWTTKGATSEQNESLVAETAEASRLDRKAS